VLALVGASPFAHSGDRRYWKSCSLHICAEKPGVILNWAVVGGELSLVTGVGLSRSMSESDAIVTGLFSDGFACEESLNLASVWNLPILYARTTSPGLNSRNRSASHAVL
jgi:TPP-dependent pyruvate/acetoin dehydrogenase alpha subunit